MKIYSWLGFLGNERENICSHFDEEIFNLHNSVSLQLLESNITQTGGTGPAGCMGDLSEGHFTSEMRHCQGYFTCKYAHQDGGWGPL
jgi:hypothetical protein